MLMVTIFNQKWFFVVGIFSSIRSTMAINSGDQFSESYNCCLNNQVPEHCAQNLCRPPDDWLSYQDDAAYYLPVSCNRHLEQIGRCLSNGRNNSACCSRSGDMRYTSCLHLCSGDAFAANFSQSKNLEYEYSACLIQHSKKTVMRCTADGYTYIPTPPVNLRAVDIGSDYAIVQWDPPTHLPHLVTSYIVQYKIVQESNNNDMVWRRAASTPDARYHLKNLRPDTSYAFHVVAETATAGNKSSDSPAPTFTTKGNLPGVTVYNSEVRGPLNSSTVLLICQVEVQGQRERALRVEWYVQVGGCDDRTAESNFRIVDSKHSEAEFFLSQDLKQSLSSKTYVAVLRIKNLAQSDYGKYKCEATNEYGTARGFLNLKPLGDNNSAADMPNSPPNLTECCLKNGVSKECLFICQNDVDQRLTAVNIRHKKCHTQIPIIEKCLNPPPAVKNSIVGSCCLSRRLPWLCLPFCEQGAPFFHNHRHSSRTKDRQFFLQCLKYTTTVFQCQLEYKIRLPYPPADLTYSSERKIDKSTKNLITVVTIKWRKSQSADRYFVYYRRIKPPPSAPTSDDWIRIDDVRDSQTNLHNLAPSSTYTLIVLAANSLGHSYSSRPIEFSIT